MKRAVIYTRVSSTDQVEGTSLETQERSCREYCAREKMEVVELFSDRGESAKTADRPKFQDMVRFSNAKANLVNYVVVYRLDRLARNNHDYAVYTAALARRGVAIRSATEPIYGGIITGSLTRGKPVDARYWKRWTSRPR
jgi:DNA invertase Pin-like site-specific DNA recombinase